MLMIIAARDELNGNYHGMFFGGNYKISQQKENETTNYINVFQTYPQNINDGINKWHELVCGEMMQ